jgi:hypothetical protein
MRPLKEVSTMSDYRDPNDRMYGSSGYEPADRRNSSWGWIAGALFLVIILALAFGVGHEPSRVASNETQSKQSQMAPPAGTTNPSPGALPGLTPPPAPSAPGKQ